MAKSYPTKTTPTPSPSRIPSGPHSNDKESPVRPRSSLAQGSDDYDGQPLNLWFEDPEKLIAAAFRRALESPEIARKFVKAAVALAEQSPDRSLRGDLRKALGSEKHRRAGRSKRNIYLCMALANAYYARHVENGEASCKAYDVLAKRHRLSTDTVRRYVAASEEYWAALQNSNIIAKD